MKRKKFWIIVVLCGLVFGAAGAYVGGRLMMKQRVLAWKTDGIAASIAGDNERAATLLERYVRRHPDDKDALRLYIKSRELAELPNVDTLAALRLLVSEEKDFNIDDQRHLLELYTKLEHRPEAVDVATAILAETSNGDVRALELKTEVLTKLLRFREALDTTDLWITKAPLALKPYMVRLSLRHQLQNPGDVLVAEAAKLHGEKPDDPRFELLEGYAYLLWSDDPSTDGPTQAERQAKAATWLKLAANHKGLSDEFVRSLIEQFDNLGMWDDALGTLQGLVNAGASPEVHHALARRLWQLGKWDQAAAELNDVDPNNPKSDPTLLALKAITLANLGKKPESDACRVALVNRTGQAAARAWVLLLRQIIDAGQVDSTKVVTECRSALASDPTNSYLAYYLGDAQARIGDLDPAIQTWIYTCRTNVTWTVPPTRLVDALIQRHRPEEALSVAYAAQRRSPNSAASIIALARAWAIGIDTGGASQSDKLYELATLVQNQLPGEDTTLAIQVELLAKQGKKDEAGKVIKTALSRSPAASEGLLLRLASMSYQFGLGLEQKCFAASEKAHGVTPDLAYAEAITQSIAGHADAGLALFDSLSKKAAAPGDARWRLARAKYLDVTSNPGAKEAWIALGDSLPGELYIQQAAANAQCVRGDWDFQQRTIDRMRVLTGEKSLGWRLARARLKVENPRNESDVEQGSVLLNDILKEYYSVPEPHVLLARALIQMKRVDGAIDHLSTAATLDPYSVPIALQLAGLCQSKGDFDRAAKAIDRVMPMIHSPAQRHAAAMLLARQGNDDKALAILQQPQAAIGEKATDDQDDLLLAAIYRQRHENDKVDAVLHKLLEKPDVPTIEFAASFYASQSRKPEAEKAMALLDGLKTAPGIKEMVWGRYYAGSGDLPNAIKHYQSATAQAPANASAWQMLALCDASMGRMDDAIAAVDGGYKALPNDKSLDAAKSKCDLLKQIGPDEQLRPLALLILRDPASSDLAAELVHTILDERQSDDVQRLASRLQQLIERHPDFLPARLSLIECLASMNRPSDALAAAQRAITAFPNQPEPAELATKLCLATNRWNEAAASAEAWKKRTPDAPLPADLAIAQAQIGLGQADAALNQLQPYLQAATSDPESHADVIMLRCMALARGGHAQDAADAIWPLAPKSAAWRVRILQVAGQIPDRHQTVKWIDHLGEIIPHDAPQERVMLAESYDQLGVLLTDAKLTSLAGEMYGELASDSKASAMVLTAVANRAERHGDPTTAEAIYRRAIKLDPDSWRAQNNLAMLIVGRGGDAKEAAVFAAAAARLQPRQPAVRDTLAEIQQKAGDLTAAAESEHAAVRLDPDNVKWKIRFAQYLLDGGNLPDAQKVVQDIQNGGDAFSHLAPADQQALSAQLTGIQKRLSAPKTL